MTDRSKSTSTRNHRAITADHEIDIQRKRYRVAILSRERLDRNSINSLPSKGSVQIEDRIKEEKRETPLVKTIQPISIRKHGRNEVQLSKLSLGFLNYDKVKKLTIFEAKAIFEKEDLKSFCDIDILEHLNSRPRSKTLSTATDSINIYNKFEYRYPFS